ncbi:SGNH/GDSL hydrolase family protein [Bradyrhizobium sp. DASA03005]|uniref:SGNH/GDSL hydrolase family protein n=1 Tax=Bradyrhizobium TaxID=374 RepID=UPI00155EEA9F|nr:MULTISPECIES: SGNH/GDSL hydrolase family protein [Bradyrhizobium]MBR1167755.1 SGNH/GDSL hydrolase family protein [Bradyrhizobium liaoningense]MDD1519517.1 GDSL family lipase [Bradyrhizobium sp. WBAH30]MDD1543761.1 GDSL family lipase [Bradyrhizobium sp. WBAH41]MDD1557954.1 GDSL family lipase [Bradyrhizobium sp. WBAH23]MDD1565366.1 GDSL family lipase [Bradyrhizobium sp. WBAH33]
MSSLRPFCLTSWLAVPAAAALLWLTPASHAQTPAQPAPAPAQSPDPAPAAPSQTTVAARSSEPRGVTSRAIDKVKEVAKSAADIFSRVPCLPPKGGSKAMGSLPHVASKLVAGQPVVIVAFGSSSTAGFGASSPEFNYPNRLAAQLRRHYPSADITVVNAGVGGEDAPEMMKRLQTQVIDVHPDLVIWQVGTNAVLRNLDPADTAKLVEDGISRIQAAGGTDIVLVDPQYSPAVNQRKESAGKMIKLLGNVAELRKVGIFPRFEVMRDWHENQSIPVESFVIADGLHMNDWGYACFAQLLGDDIIRSVGQIKLGVNVPADVRTYRPM